MRPMRAVVALLALVLLLSVSTAWAAEHPSLAKARALYNAGDFDGAINAAAVSRREPGERGRLGDWSSPAPISSGTGSAPTPRIWAPPARRLGSVRSAALTPRDQVDLLVGLGQSLYLGEVFGAAAELFDTALSRADAPARARSAAAARLVGDGARPRSADAPDGTPRTRLRAHRRADGSGAAGGSGEHGRELLARGCRPRQRRRRPRLGRGGRRRGCARRSGRRRRNRCASISIASSRRP